MIVSRLIPALATNIALSCNRTADLKEIVLFCEKRDTDTLANDEKLEIRGFGNRCEDGGGSEKRNQSFNCFNLIYLIPRKFLIRIHFVEEVSRAENSWCNNVLQRVDVCNESYMDNSIRKWIIIQAMWEEEKNFLSLEIHLWIEHFLIEMKWNERLCEFSAGLARKKSGH